MKTESNVEALLKTFIKEATDGNEALLAERARCHNEINKLSHIPDIHKEEPSFTLDLRVRRVCELLDLAYPHLKKYRNREEYLISKSKVFTLQDVCRALDHLHSKVEIDDGAAHIYVDCRDTICLTAFRCGASMIRKLIKDNESLNDSVEAYKRRALSAEESLDSQKSNMVQKMESELCAANLEIANLRERLRKQKEVADRWEDEVDTVNARLIEERKMYHNSFYGKIANEVQKVLNDAAIPVCNGSDADAMTLAERVQWCIDDNACSHIKALQDEVNELKGKGTAIYQDASILYATGLDTQAEAEKLKKELESTKQSLSEARRLWAEDVKALKTRLADDRADRDEYLDALGIANTKNTQMSTKIKEQDLQIQKLSKELEKLKAENLIVPKNNGAIPIFSSSIPTLIKPEPSRIEIAAGFIAATFIHHGAHPLDDTIRKLVIDEADALIAFAKKN